ncbi:hypothetical protein AHAS_Ahas03G0108900 [Arachis hypogaea]
MASRRRGHMLQLENQRLHVLTEVMINILQLENQLLHIPHQHPDQTEDQVDLEPEPIEEHIPEPIPEEDIPVEQISVSPSKPSSKELLTTSISGPTSIGQTSSMSAEAPLEIVEISDDEDKDPEECSNVIVIFSDDDS